MTEITLTIPLVPPSVNHYKMRSRTGHWYVTKEALAFKAAVAIYARGAKVEAERYCIDAIVFLGKRKRGDADNFNKCIGDGLKDAGVIHSDAAVKDWRVRVERDWANPRTVLTVRAI
jgi:Holliday junction resolvase RusA-like endonuclease